MNAPTPDISLKKPFSIPTLDIQQCFAVEPPEYDFVLPGFLVGTVGGLVAPGGAGKSTYALEAAVQIACAVAGGPDLLNLGQLKPGKVIILAGEDPHISLWHRIRSIKQYLNPAQQKALTENLIIKECVGLGIDLMTPEHAAYIEEISRGARLVIVDTLTRFHSLDENKADDAKAVMSVLEGNAHRTNAAYLYLHHVNKAAATSGTADLQQAARGSSVFVDNARWLSFIACMTEQEAAAAGIEESMRRKYLRWNISKQNYSGPRGDQWLSRSEGGILVAGDLTFSSDRPEAYKKSGARKNSKF